MKNTSLTRILLGSFIVFIGLSLLFQQFNVPLVQNILSLFWPIVLLVAGTFFLINKPRRVLVASFLLLGGLIILFGKLFNLNISIWNLWPLVLVLIGINVLFSRKEVYETPKESLSEDDIDQTAIFWGSDKKVVSNNFRGGSITVAFGGAKLDLRGVKFVNSTATLNTITVFGGTEILLDSNTKVINKGMGVLGAFEDKTRPSEVATQTLVLTGFAAFGGLEVK